MFHSIYGTEGFQGHTFDIGRRKEVAAVIGEAAELTVFVNCVMDRSSLDAAVNQLLRGPAPAELRIRTRPEVVGPHVPKEITLSEEQLVDLCKVHLADYLNLVVEYKFWHYRRSELRDMVQLFAGPSGKLAKADFQKLVQ